MSDTTTLAEALLAAQSEMKNPAFDTTNPHFKSRFASLAGVRAAVLPVLNKHGIALVQDLTTTERGVACRTVLIKGGEQMWFGPLEIPATKNDAQGFGSAATYARRYSLQTAVCVVGDDDDDANAACRKESPKGSASPRDGMEPVDPIIAQDWADDMARAIEADDLGAVLKIHAQLNREPNVYTAAADLLSAKERATWKSMKGKA